jgi:hypothetical protein
MRLLVIGSVEPWVALRLDGRVTWVRPERDGVR